MLKTIKNIKEIILILLVTFSITTFAQQVPESTAKTIEQAYTKLLKNKKGVGLSMAIVHKGEIVYAKGFGYADKENEIKANENTVYRIGSITKSFTSLAIMQLQEKGKLNVNQSLLDFIPELKIQNRFNEEKPFLIGDVLSHLSGLPSDIYNGFVANNPPNTKWLIEELNKQTTISPSKYKDAYSNVGYHLLGEVIARASNTSYNEYVNEHIFKPLQMNSSFIKYDDKLTKNYAKAYINGDKFEEPLLRDEAAGMIHSTVLNMANYVKMLLKNGSFKDHKLISSIEQMTINRMKNTILVDNINEGYGYGLTVKNIEIIKNGKTISARSIGHNGNTFGYASDFSFIPELDLGVVVLTNSDTGKLIRSANRLLKLYAKHSLKQDIEFNKNPIKIEANLNEKSCSKDEIKGIYNFAGMILKINEANKIKIKKGPATIILKRNEKTGIYDLKAKLFGLIPIGNMDGNKIKFVKIDNKIFIKMIDKKNNKEGFAGNKLYKKEIPQSWKNIYGKYKMVKSNFICDECPKEIDYRTTRLKIYEENGFVVFETKGKAKDANQKLYLNVLSKYLAVTQGVGRETGQTIRILENKNIYYSGYEFLKK